jgi:hypothetical protein
MPRVTGVRRDRRLNGHRSKRQGPNGQCKASINPAAAASLSAANWQRKCETKAAGLSGPSVVPVVLFVWARFSLFGSRGLTTFFYHKLLRDANLPELHLFQSLGARILRTFHSQERQPCAHIECS